MFFGGRLLRMQYPMHGKISTVTHNGHPLFGGISTQFQVMRYHSLAIDSLQGTGLSAIATTADGTVMALVHNNYPCTGVQFHPESIGTPQGLQIIKNWISLSQIQQRPAQ
jgi:anthranilate/para-aminobenzoate synthase component II